MTRRVTAWAPAASRRVIARPIRAIQERLSDRIHAAGDAHAQAMGWAIALTTGRFGMSGRAYRDPRFAVRRDAATTSAAGRRPAA